MGYRIGGCRLIPERPVLVPVERTRVRLLGDHVTTPVARPGKAEPMQRLPRLRQGDQLREHRILVLHGENAPLPSRALLLLVGIGVEHAVGDHPQPRQQIPRQQPRHHAEPSVNQLAPLRRQRYLYVNPALGRSSHRSLSRGRATRNGDPEPLKCAPIVTQPSGRCKPGLSQSLRGRCAVGPHSVRCHAGSWPSARDRWSLPREPALRLRDRLHGAETSGCLWCGRLRSEVLQRSNELSAARGRQSAHSGTVTRWTPTNSSSCVSVVPSTSRHSSIDSRMRSMSSSSDAACV